MPHNAVMIKKLLVAVSLASAIGMFSAAKEVIRVTFAEPVHNCMDHSGEPEPAVLAHHEAHPGNSTAAASH